MIVFKNLVSISPIFLTVALIVFLILVELGNKKIRSALLPLVIVLMIIFLIVATLSVISML